MPLDQTNWPTDTDEPTAILIAAHGLLERGWCQGFQAKDIQGRIVPATSDDAVAWCAYGAIMAAGLDSSDEALVAAFNRFQAVIPYRAYGRRIGLFNDSQATVEPVLAAFDRAIAAGSDAALRECEIGEEDQP